MAAFRGFQSSCFHFGSACANLFGSNLSDIWVGTSGSRPHTDGLIKPEVNVLDAVPSRSVNRPKGRCFRGMRMYRAKMGNMFLAPKYVSVLRVLDLKHVAVVSLHHL